MKTCVILLELRLSRKIFLSFIQSTLFLFCVNSVVVFFSRRNGLPMFIYNINERTSLYFLLTKP